MTTPSTCSPITIFEGPDASGKTTLARQYAEQTGARYVHHGPYRRAGKSLGALYVESMLPALLGYQPVVLDRCWISEPIYGQVFRGGAVRLDGPHRRLLERLAFRAGALVVVCLPPRKQVEATWRARQGDELLDNLDQLREVHRKYNVLTRHRHLTALPTLTYDYTRHACLDPELVDLERPLRHDTRALTAGNLGARVLLVGESFAEIQASEPLYRWPFGSLSGAGCSLWLAQQLAGAGISEAQLAWVNADQLDLLHDLAAARYHVVALGDAADAKLTARGWAHDTIPHPQYWKRFHHRETYPLAALLRRIV